MDYLQGPSVELAENRFTSSVLRARRPRAIRLDALFWRDLSYKMSRGAVVIQV